MFSIFIIVQFFCPFQYSMDYQNHKSGESNHWQFGFQAGRFRSSISVRFEIQLRIRISDRNFYLNSIYFRIKLITFDLFLIYFRLKDWKQPSKCRLINREWRIILKTMIYIENLVILDNFRLNWTNFWYKLNPNSKSESEFESNRRDE